MDTTYRIVCVTLVIFSVVMVACTLTQLHQELFCETNVSSMRNTQDGTLADFEKVNNDFLKFTRCLLILLSGDVETNPGPTDSETVKLHKELLSEIRSVKDDITKEMKELKAETVKMNIALASIRSDIADVRSRQDIIRVDVDEVADRLETLEAATIPSATNNECTAKLVESVERLGEEIDKQEQYSRRNNVILYGLPEKPRETAATCKKYVCDVLNDNADNEDNEITTDCIVAAHRLNTKKGKSPKPMIVKFLYPEDKVRALGLRENLKENKYGISSDLTKYQRSRLQELKESNKFGYYKHGKLHITDRRSPTSTDNTVAMDATDSAMNTGDRLNTENGSRTRLRSSQRKGAQ